MKGLSMQYHCQTYNHLRLRNLETNLEVDKMVTCEEASCSQDVSRIIRSRWIILFSIILVEFGVLQLVVSTFLF
jgi:hypothetical protein